ncbi:S26 family signal peptidase [Ferruginibacter albus]|uniref:S26 family signal peptidase n=1 Tax=Ferruginibacter albus TaxID=2875540 RepID=UPI001CC7E471|nr:S26 family signal peptidase [Ferruginibacter albus]UAY50939.1 S26 family signal peptidase [Ferruginibacter albus]
MKPSLLLGICSCVISSCNINQKIKVKVSGADMENTITQDAQVTINKNLPVKYNCIIGFSLSSSNEINFSRVEGLPGDTVEIRNGDIYLNNKYCMPPNEKVLPYMVYMTQIKGDILEKYKNRHWNNDYYIFYITKEDYSNIVNIVDSIYLLKFDSSFVDNRLLKGLNHSNKFDFGPLIVPKKDQIIDNAILSLAPTYLSHIDLGNKLNDDYYFCVGDNFIDATDSRTIGLIPKSSIVGIVESISNVNRVYVEP